MMAGAGKRRGNAERQSGQVVSSNKHEIGPSKATPLSDNQLSGSFDGPSDDRSTQGQFSRELSSALGYDRDNSNRLIIPYRLELPSGAYQSVSLFKVLRVLINRPNSIHFRERQFTLHYTLLMKFTPLIYPAPTLSIYNHLLPLGY